MARIPGQWEAWPGSGVTGVWREGLPSPTAASTASVEHGNAPLPFPVEDNPLHSHNATRARADPLDIE